MIDLLDPSAHGWRQGVLLPRQLPGLDLTSLSFNPPLTLDDCLVIITQDCDLVHCSFEEEPSLEVIAARLVQQGNEDPNKRDGKNPRRLQYEILRPAGIQLFESWMGERRSLQRELLCTGADSYTSLENKELQILKRWLGRRYNRTALPNEFNRRVAPAQSKLVERLKTKGYGISGILLSIDSFAELPATVSYRVSVLFVMRSSDYTQSAVQKNALAVLDFLKGLLLRCEGIDIESATVLTEDDLTIADMRRLVTWDYADYLSQRAGHAPELPASS